MALLNRLFSSRKKQQPEKGYGQPVSAQLNRKIFEFNKDQVRILLFRECERRGRKLLFDSKAVRKVPLPNSSECGKLQTGLKTDETRKGEASCVEITNGFGYQYTRPTSDVKVLGEMIFGSVAMAFRGSTFKVHVGGCPPVLMLTKVANSPSKRTSDRGLEDSYGSSINSMNDYFAGGTSSSDSKISTLAGSCPLDVPLPSSLKRGESQAVRSVGHNLGSLEADSGCYTNSECSITGLHTNGSFNAALASPDSCKGSGGSLSSLRRRWLRTASTSLDLDSSQSLTHADSLASCGSLPACGDDKPLRRTKLGITVIISLTEHQRETMQEFLLEHSALLESMVVRLHTAVERAYCRKELFVSMMFDASFDVKQSIEDLLLGPRLPVPLWLGLLSSGAPHSQAQHLSIASGFMQELCQMLEDYDTKDTNFFMSTLITAVLTHHLGWVPTVTPGLHQCLQQSNPDKLKSSSTLSDLPKLYPYNPLWAQAMDLYGALGHPLKTSRTIVMTSLASNRNRIETIEKILRIMSYFIRCAALERHEPKLQDCDFQSSLTFCSNLSKPDVAQLLSIDDRTSSSSTLRPLSGKCSPHLTACQATTPVSSRKISDCCSLKSKSLITTENISSKSENSLNVEMKESNCEMQSKKPSSKGLRRTMSYSSRITSAAVDENEINKDMVFFSGACEEFLSSNHFSGNESRLPCDRVNNFGSQPSTRDSNPSLEKVMFVLGENEDLVNLKGRRKQDKEPELTKVAVEGKGKPQDQPLSFSGSEVESGFSECESFELSPVRSASENFLAHSRKESEFANTCSPGLRSRLQFTKYDKNMGKARTCRMNIFKKDDSKPFHYILPQIVTVQPAFDKFKEEKDSSSGMTSNLRSLARSLSVNLPVCFKWNKYEVPGSEFCITCGSLLSSVVERKENIHPLKEWKQSNTKKHMKRLRRAHSSFCIRSQNRKSIKSMTLCQNCHSSKEDPCIVKGNEHIFCEELLDSRLSPQPLDEKCEPSNVIEIPVPSSRPLGECTETSCEWGIASSLFGSVSSHYIPERVLQGCAPLGQGWEMTLRRDLALEAQHPCLDPGVSEAVAIVANVDSWEVQLISSHTYVVDRSGTIGVRAGLSQLVANMLESVYHMWKLHASPDSCLSFIESRLQEMLLRSQALSDFLLTSEFCSMETLISSLSLEANDVPLLMSVASTHSPEVTQRYGLSFR